MFRIAATGEKSVSPVPYAAIFDVAQDGRVWLVREGALSVATQQGQMKTLASVGAGAATVDGPLGSSPASTVSRSLRVITRRPSVRTSGICKPCRCRPISVRVLDRSGAWGTLATKPYTFTRRIVGTAMVASYALDARDLGVSPSGAVFVGGAGGIYQVDATRGWTATATPAGQPADAIGRDGPVAAAGFAGAAQLVPDATGLVFYDGQTCQVRRLEGTQLTTLSGPKLASPEFAGAGFLGGSTAGALLVAYGAAPSSLAPSPRGRCATLVGLGSAKLSGWVRTDPPAASSVYHELRLYRVDLATGFAAVVAGATIDSPVFGGRRVDLSAVIAEGDGGPALIQRRGDGGYWLSNGKELWLLDAGGQLRRIAGLATAGGGADGSGTAASFGLIASVRVLPDNRLLVVDQGAHAVRLASDDGRVVTLVGQLNQAGQILGALPARLESPVDVWPIGRDLYITTTSSRRLLRASNAL